MLAVKNKQRQFIKLLVKRFANDLDINACSPKFGVALIVAIKIDEFETAHMILQDDRCNVICSNPEDGNTPLHLLFSKFNENSSKTSSLCRKLITLGVNVNQKNKNDMTPLHLAV
jgi:ankyrin repeat protein